ncbi:MAG TPA: ABC transporter ATP-binding protein [Solirubrobacterales bacterium]|nr:ABC transporter ATP-binding protein [Solirubrobacterales bacterium]
MLPAVLELREIEKSYPQGGEMVEVLHGVSLEIEPGKLVAIVGPSGSGKSTLLNLIGTLDVPSAGSLRFDGREIGSLGQKERARFRAANLGFIFQFFNLLPGLTARQNVELAAAIAGGEKHTARARAGELLGRVGLGEKAEAPARNLSGGQMQRVAIARALVNEPRLILADEPTGNLDQRNAHGILELLRQQTAEDRSVVMVTHDHDLADRYADQIISLVDGRVADLDRSGPNGDSDQGLIAGLAGLAEAGWPP